MAILKSKRMSLKDFKTKKGSEKNEPQQQKNELQTEESKASKKNDQVSPKPLRQIRKDIQIKFVACFIFRILIFAGLFLWFGSYRSNDYLFYCWFQNHESSFS